MWKELTLEREVTLLLHERKRLESEKRGDAASLQHHPRDVKLVGNRLSEVPHRVGYQAARKHGIRSFEASDNSLAKQSRNGPTQVTISVTRAMKSTVETWPSSKPSGIDWKLK
ncbi:hypothetical protein NL676_004196 [Syzygium grande]|nr:hypothetical protein NL676_004196 [Syzygium grande]